LPSAHQRELQISDIQQRLNDALSERDESRRRLAVLEQELQAVRSEVDAVRGQLTGAEPGDCSSPLESLVANLRQDKEKLAKANTELNQQFREVKEQYESLIVERTRFNAVDNSNTALFQQTRKLQEQLDMSTQNEKRLQSELKATQAILQSRFECEQEGHASGATAQIEGRLPSGSAARQPSAANAPSSSVDEANKLTAALRTLQQRVALILTQSRAKALTPR